MELADASIFAPTGASSEIVQQVDEAISEIERHRPLSRGLTKRLSEEILYDRVHSSAVTEGNRLSRRETIVVLTTGVVESGSRRDVIEVKNLAKAILQLQEMLEKDDKIDSVSFRQLRRIVMKDLLDDPDSGCYRKEEVAISGAKHQPPIFLDVPDLITRILSDVHLVNSSFHPLQQAAWAHWAIARIHPFKDGNGRIARLVQDYVLLRSHYVPAALQAVDREGAYYAALEAADDGNGKPLLEMIAKNSLSLADKYLTLIREETERHDWLDKVTKAATERVKQTSHRRFLIFQRSVNLLRNEFANLAKELSERVPSLDVNFKDYGGIDQERFSQLEKTGKAKKTWFFGLEFSVGETRLRYIFWHGIHHNRPEDIANVFPSKIVLLLSAEEEFSYY
jgi:Fic family protein